MAKCHYTGVDFGFYDMLKSLLLSVTPITTGFIFRLGCFKAPLVRGAVTAGD